MGRRSIAKPVIALGQESDRQRPRAWTLNLRLVMLLTASLPSAPYYPRMSSGRITRAAIKALDGVAGRVLPKSRRAAHLEVGRKGEEEAYFQLRRLGYVMVARNYRSPRSKGEIDLVGWDGEVLCFVEVKTRTTRAVAPAEAAVDEDKQRELRAVAREYLRRVKTDRGRGGRGTAGEGAGGTCAAGAAGATAAPLGMTSPEGPIRGRTGYTSKGVQYRYDVVSIYFEAGRPPDFTLFKNAFPMS